MGYQNLLTNIRDKIFFITINREQKLNALNKETLHEIHLAVREAIADEEVGGLIITGAGTKAFIAGADISEFSSFNENEGKELARQGHLKVFDFIENSPKPVLAAINGFALGGGLELAMACHIRIAADNAKLGLPEVSLGLIPGYGGTQRLTQLVGKGKAMEMILSANMLTADEAQKIGLVNQVVPQQELIAVSENLMLTILSRSPKALSAAIKSVNASLIKNVNGFETEIEEFSKCFGNADFKEGVTAFLEKRKPNF